jgi:hypothetical protein
MLGLFGIAPAAAVAKEAEISPGSINNFIRSQVRFANEHGWERVPPTAEYVTSVREIWKMEYVGEPITWVEGREEISCPPFR